MEYAIVVIMLALAQYLFFTMKTGLSRGKYGIDAPKCVGDENFERIFRIQQNTMEQLIVFIPALLTFSYYVSPVWGPVIGLIFIAGRFVYFNAYINEPAKRGPGMMMTLLANAVLVLGTIIGIIISMI
ncbi:MAG: MAPEG family protein [Proteobacteria bacterium]|nr:MAPEG family protein [Pseudomonadota bacterium]